MSEKTHANIPVFIPHLGCPNDCVFCDQRTISGRETFREEDVQAQIETALETMGQRVCEIAFFGGSFTGIERDLMIRLLDMAESFVRSGRVSGIRMSTRPDYISEEIIDIIKKYTLSEVELGIQSMSEKVLALSRRGHTADDTRRAAKLLREAEIDFVGQMMIGLPGSTGENEVYCADEICRLGASGCRIYPTVVFKNTSLATMTERGEYTPLSVEEATRRSADVLEVFESHGVRCLRIGLQDSENLHSEERYLAGPAHPALGEMVRADVFLRRIESRLKALGDASEIEITVPRGKISMAAGHCGSNKKYVAEKYGIKKIKFNEDEALTGLNLRVAKLR